MALLLVSDVCPTQVSRADGALLRQAIEARWSDEEILDVDFDGLRIASVSFFDESFGVLSREHSIDLLKRRLRPINLRESDRLLLNTILSRHGGIEREVRPTDAPPRRPSQPRNPGTR
jgi:hypothetical protein